MKIRVYYEDTDLGGIVYHANYLKYCERARSELFFEKGASPVIDGGHFVVLHIDATFKQAAKLGELLDVSTEVLEVRGASMTLRQRVRRGGALLFDMTIKLAYVKEGRVGRLSEAARAQMLDLLG